MKLSNDARDDLRRWLADKTILSRHIRGLRAKNDMQSLKDTET